MDLGEEEELDAETLRNAMSMMQEELAALRANQEIVAETNEGVARKDKSSLIVSREKQPWR